MFQVNRRYYVCEEGHITAGPDQERIECQADTWQLNYVEGKRKTRWVQSKKATPCGKKIIEIGDIPRVMDFHQVWEPKIMHAFLIGQKIDADFMITLQGILVHLMGEIEKIKEKK
jgi:hypothetical protein